MKNMMIIALSFCFLGHSRALDSIEISGITKGVDAKSFVKVHSFLEDKVLAQTNVDDKNSFRVVANLQPGIYRLLFKKNKKDLYLDVFVSGKESKINFEFDTNANQDIPVFLSSEANKEWYDYKLNINKLFSKIGLLDQFLLYYKETDDLERLTRQKLKDAKAEYEAFRKRFIDEQNGSLLAKVVTNLSNWFPQKSVADRRLENIEHIETYWNQTVTATDIDLVNTPVYVTHVNTYLGLYMKSYNVEEGIPAIKKGVDILMAKFSDNFEVKKQVVGAIIDVLSRPDLEDVLRYFDQTYVDTSLLTGDKLKNYAIRLGVYRTFKKGNPVPDIPFTSNGKPFSLKAFIGKKVIVAFWSSDCGHCKEDMPKLNTFIKNRKDIAVLAVCVDNEKASYTSFVKKLDAMYHRCDFKVNSKPVMEYFIRSTPEFFLLDGSLKFVEKYTSYDTLSKNGLLSM